MKLQEFYNWINLVLGLLVVIFSIFAASGTWMLLLIIVGLLIIIFSYLSQQQTKKG